MISDNPPLSHIGVRHSWLQRFAFASPEISLTLAFATVNSWYFYFLVNILELAPALAGSAFVIGRVTDAIFDPIAGKMADLSRRTRSSPKAILKRAILPMALLYLSIWILPSKFENDLLVFVAAVISFASFTIAYSFVSVPRLSLLPDLEKTPHGKTVQTSFDMTFVYLSILVAVAGIPLAVSQFSASNVLADSTPNAWGIVTACISIAILVFAMPFVWFVKPPNVLSERVNKSNRRKNQFRVALGFDMAGRSVLVFFFCVTSMTFLQSMLPFFLEVNLGFSGESQSAILGGVFVTSILSFPIWVQVSRTVGKTRGLTLSAIPFFGFLLLFPFLPNNGTIGNLLIAGIIFAGTGVAAISLFSWTMVPEAAANFSKEQKGEFSGVVTSIFTFTNKFASAIAIGMNALVLSISDFVPGQSSQTDETSGFILVSAMLIPMGLFAIALTILWMKRTTEPN